MRRSALSVRRLLALLGDGTRAVVRWLASVGSRPRKVSADSRTRVAAPHPTAAPERPHLISDTPCADTFSGQHGNVPATQPQRPSGNSGFSGSRDQLPHFENGRSETSDSEDVTGRQLDQMQYAPQAPEEDLHPHTQESADAEEPEALSALQRASGSQSPQDQTDEESSGDSETSDTASPSGGIPSSPTSQPADPWEVRMPEPESSTRAAVPTEEKGREQRPPFSAESAEPITENRAAIADITVGEEGTLVDGSELEEPEQPTPPNRPRQSPSPVGRYRPRLGVSSEATKSKAPVAPASPSTEADPASLSAEIVVTFNPGEWGINLRLLLRRQNAMPEELVVSVGESTHELWAIDDEFFDAIALENAEDALRSGIAAHADVGGGSSARWVRTGRGLHVFAPRPGIAGFVSVPRIMSGTENVVICTADLVAQVTELVRQTGSQLFRQVNGPGIPDRWCCFRAIRPLHPLRDGMADGLLLALSPRAELEIEFRGGIRIERSQWLVDAPPAIRVIGEIRHGQTVLIDGQSAIATDDGIYSAEGWDTLGTHKVECAGVTRSYELTKPHENWQWWPAHCGDTLAVCGARVSSVSGTARAVSCYEPSWLVGANPGEVNGAVPRKGQTVVASAPEFAPVWAIPISARRRSQGYVVTLVGAPSPPAPRIPPGSSMASVKRWCSVIRGAAHLRLPTDPAGQETEMLFREYKLRARQLARMLK